MLLGEVARDAALTVDGVADVERGVVGAVVSLPGGRSLPGVMVVGRADGRYDVGLALVARPVRLGPLAERVREVVAAAARSAGVAGALGRIDVGFADLEGPAE